jgi:mono/diheme cytochrome c family protein
MNAEPTKPVMSGTDEAEPTAGNGPMPILLIVIFAVVIYLGMIYLDAHGGGFDPQVYQPYASREVLQDKQPPTAGAEPGKRGKIVFQTCSQCHQPDGRGSTALFAPPLAGSDWVQAEGPNRIIRIVLNGLTGPITVNGNQYGGGSMTAFGTAFSDEQIADVLTYERQAWGNKAGPVKPEQVKAIRAQVAEKPDAWNSADLLKIPDKD